MNILFSHSWLSEFLKTKASSKEIQKTLSLCGQSVESVTPERDDYIYNVEITSNRPDAMSVAGIARELAAILPRFKIPAEFINDPYKIETQSFSRQHSSEVQKKLRIKTDQMLNPRFTAIVADNANVSESPNWLKKRLIQTGMRPINNVVDVTNYIMKTYGQPVHAFDFSEIKTGQSGLPTMILRASKKGEKITTLDDKEHLLPGNDIVIEDGSGRLIDLCGIMGGSNSHISQKSKSIVLFLQTYSPEHIRRTVMTLGHHTDAAALFEKGLDPELVLPSMTIALKLILELTGGQAVSKLYDIYPHPYKPYQVLLSLKKLESYLGINLKSGEIKKILSSLGFKTEIINNLITATVPSFRQDIKIAEDLIEEIARIYGYHNLPSRVLVGSPIEKGGDPNIVWIEKTKDILKYWGFSEVYTSSLVSAESLEKAGFDPQKSIRLKNPLTTDGEYLRPSIIPEIVKAVNENAVRSDDAAKLFELSKVYLPKRFIPSAGRAGDLNHFTNKEPVNEALMLTGAINDTSTESFYKLKGVVEELFKELGIVDYGFKAEVDNSCPIVKLLHPTKRLAIEIKREVCGLFGQMDNMLIFDLDFEEILKHVSSQKTYQPIPQYPPVIEDLTFVFPEKTYVGLVITAIKSIDQLIVKVELIDSYEQTRTFRINYQNPKKSLTDNEVKIIRGRMIKQITASFKAKVK